jgi:hypothetical protein
VSREPGLSLHVAGALEGERTIGVGTHERRKVDGR